jgi:hypothetical protein
MYYLPGKLIKGFMTLDAVDWIYLFSGPACLKEYAAQASCWPTYVSQALRTFAALS